MACFVWLLIVPFGQGFLTSALYHRRPASAFQCHLKDDDKDRDCQEQESLSVVLKRALMRTTPACVHLWLRGLKCTPTLGWQRLTLS